MFGLEKKGRALFEFDLEKDLKPILQKQRSAQKQSKTEFKRLKTP